MKCLMVAQGLIPLTHLKKTPTKNDSSQDAKSHRIYLSKISMDTIRWFIAQ